MSLRVAMIAACPFPWPRGTPVRVERLAEALARRGHDVHVATYHLGRPLTDPPFALHRIRDVPAYRYTDPGPTVRKLLQLDPMLVGLLRRLERELRFDVVHAHHYEGLLVALLAAGAAPVVYDAHTTLAGELPYHNIGMLPRWLKRRIGGWIDRQLPRRAAHVIAVSESIRASLRSGGALADERISVVSGGVELSRFEIGARTRPAGARVIFTGNLSAYQGVDLMLDAFTRLRRRRPEATLLLVTDSSFAPFEDEARRLGIREAIEVRSASIDEQAALLADADVALNPRVSCDGVPQKLLNYMAAGKPIVSFEGSAVYLEHERTGLRVPNGCTEDMAAAIARLLDDRDLAGRLGRAAGDLARREFSWDGSAARVEQVYRRLLG